MTQNALPLEGVTTPTEPVRLDPLVAIPRRSGLFPKHFLWMIEICADEDLEEVVVSRVVSAPSLSAAAKYAEDILIPTAVLQNTVDNEVPPAEDFVISQIALVSWEAGWTNGVDHLHLDYVQPRPIE